MKSCVCSPRGRPIRPSPLPSSSVCARLSIMSPASSPNSASTTAPPLPPPPSPLGSSTPRLRRRPSLLSCHHRAPRLAVGSALVRSALRRSYWVLATKRMGYLDGVLVRIGRRCRTTYCLHASEVAAHRGVPQGDRSRSCPVCSTATRSRTTPLGRRSSTSKQTFNEPTAPKVDG